MGNLEGSGFEGKAQKNNGFPITMQLKMKRYRTARITFSL